MELDDEDQFLKEWLSVGKEIESDGKTRIVRLKIALAHPFSARFAVDQRTITLLVRMAIAIALSEITAREAGVASAGAIRRHLNELLQSVMVHEKS